MKKLFRLLRRLVVLACVAAVILTVLPPLARKADQLLYPRKYSQQVEQWAAPNTASTRCWSMRLSAPRAASTLLLLPASMPGG